MLTFKKKLPYIFWPIIVLILLLNARQIFSAPPQHKTLVINEFMAANRANPDPTAPEQPLLDEDQDPSDWIEIYNAGGETIDLEIGPSLITQARLKNGVSRPLNCPLRVISSFRLRQRP